MAKPLDPNTADASLPPGVQAELDAGIPLRKASNIAGLKRPGTVGRPKGGGDGK